jgi:TPP-dependent pyruvate/acetoin dehydrogenase alpha subunit
MPMERKTLNERIYRSLRYIRSVEEKTAEIYPGDKIKSPIHLSIGQESVTVGVCTALHEDDVVAGTYRSHASYLAKGGDLGRFFAELYGKQTGCAAGKGGSMHLIDMNKGILGSSAIVGTNIPVAVGYALALKREGKQRITAVFFGDGATEEGVFYESLNFAALHKLPVIFVCENNGLAIHTPLSKRWASEDLCARVKGFGIPTAFVEDGDVFRIWDITSQAAQKIRAGEIGPFFIECKTYRWREHVGPNDDHDAAYRSRQEFERWVKMDQVELVGKMLDAESRKAIDHDIERQIALAVEFAEKSPFPGPEELSTHVFA